MSKIATIAEDRLGRFLSDDIQLKKGEGKGILPDGTFDMCVMQAVDWITGGPGKTDSPACVDTAVTRFCIRLNDAPQFEEFRDELKPYAPRIANTAGGIELTRKRAFMCADWAVRTIAPMAIDAYPKHADLALQLRDLPEIVDAKTSHVARDAARIATKELRAANCAAAFSASYAAAAADAYAANAATNTYAANAAAYAANAVYAAYAAAYAAYAATANAATNAYAASADARGRRRWLWDASLAHLTRMIKVRP